MEEHDQEIIASLRGVYEAFNREDFDAAMEIAHPEMEFIRPGGQSSVRGTKAMRAWMEPDAFEEQVVEPLEFTVEGDKVLVRQHARARGAGSGIEMEIDSWAVWTLDETGLATRLEFYLNHQKAEALEADGLRE